MTRNNFQSFINSIDDPEQLLVQEIEKVMKILEERINSIDRLLTETDTELLDILFQLRRLRKQVEKGK